MNRKILAVVNLFGLAAVIIINTLADQLPLAGITTGEVSDLYANLFTPAGVTFTIWGLIYIMLIGFVGYQLYSAFSGSGTGGAVIDRTGGLFLMSCALNILWIYAWHNLRIGWSMVIILALLLNLFFLYQRIHYIKDGRAATVLWGRTPFSLYLGWITIAALANINVFLVSIGFNWLGMEEIIWTTGLIVLGALINLWVLSTFRDWVFVLAGVWAFLGITMKQWFAYPTMGTIALITALVLLIAAITALVKRLRKGGPVNLKVDA